MGSPEVPSNTDVALDRPRRGVVSMLEGMAFYVVMIRTIRDLMGLKRTLVLVLGGQVLVTFLAQVSWSGSFQAGTMSLEMQTSFLVGYFIIVSFFWMTGFFLAYLVVGTSGLDLIDQERRKGTLLLIVSKPISRLHFLLGKLLALVLTSMMLEAVILSVSALVLWALLGLDPDTMSALLGVLPWVFLFSLLVIYMFAALSMTLSTLVRSALVRNAVFTIIVVIVFVAGPVMRMGWSSIYEDYRLYYVDGSYNLGNAYVLMLDRAETGRLAPQSQAWLGITTGAYKAGTEVLLTTLVGATGAFDPDIGAMPPSMERTTYVAPAVSLVFILAIGTIALGVAGWVIRREEVK
ncbi:ABC transporter permease [Chloroflexota bacterium]